MSALRHPHAQRRATASRRDRTWRTDLVQAGVLVLVGWLALQAYWVARVGAMVWINPASTTFQRSEIWRMASQQGRVVWAQEWVNQDRLSDHLKRAVIASEDAGFVDHTGVEWDAIERAWERNQQQALQAAQDTARARPGHTAAPKVYGGSTITQQLAKNLFLSGERSHGRKAQELLVTWSMEAVLSKARILEIYLNHVEWGEGLFGANMASRYYFRTDAAQLTRLQAARLAVVLPAPKRHEKRWNSPYLQSRAATVAANMHAVTLP